MRKLSQREVLGTVLKTWHDQDGLDGFSPSVRHTAWFLWLLVVAALVLGGVATIALLYPAVDEHCQHGTAAGSHVKCVQRAEVHLDGEGERSGHAAIVFAPTVQKYVHGGRA